MSAISPTPQLRDEGIEKSGTSIPARRAADDGVMTGCEQCNESAAARPPRESLHEPQAALEGVVEDRGFGQKADNHERLEREIEKIARMHQDALRRK